MKKLEDETRKEVAEGLKQQGNTDEAIHNTDQRNHNQTSV